MRATIRKRKLIRKKNIPVERIVPRDVRAGEVVNVGEGPARSRPLSLFL